LPGPAALVLAPTNPPLGFLTGFKSRILTVFSLFFFCFGILELLGLDPEFSAEKVKLILPPLDAA
jgi:hypothetical protein